MAEIVISTVAKLAEYLVDPVVRHGQYLFCVGKIAKSLEIEKEKLATAQRIVQKHVEESLNRIEKIDDVVEKWLGEVKSLIDEVEKLEKQMMVDNNCLKGCYPNWKRHHLGKQMIKMIETTQQLHESSDFKQFSVPAALPDIEYFSSRYFVYFQSTKLASDELLDAMKEDGNYMIGLYGMGGSGKTTLVKEVGKKAKELKLFDRVIFTNVSQTPDVRKIQGEIADLLGLKLDEETEPGRARRLSMRLSSGERILIILDDVWAKIDLKDIGIPFEEYHVGCKVLLTTRRQQVCNMMDCKRKILLHLLSEEEAWTLFQKHAGFGDEYFNSLIGVAQEVARECKRLPIAIEAVGTSLKGKSVEEWNVALKKLRDSKPINVEEGVKDAFTCLQLSYDYLRSEEAKSLFLMCCIFPDYHEIVIEDLFKIGVGLGLSREVDSFETIRNEVNACINNLIDSCLLMHSEKKKDHLKMHDMVRDVALWIASNEDRAIMVNLLRDLNALAMDETIKDCYAITFWCNEIDCIPQHLNAPKLEVLLLKTSSSLKFSEAAFKRMEKLKVVVMVNENYYPKPCTSLSQSMQLLTNLQTLRLEGWILGDLSWVVCLKRLQILDLKRSWFQELPNGLEKLKKLKLLDLSGCEIKERDYKVIGRCTQLEELYAFNNQFHSRIKKAHEFFSDNVTFPNLQRYILMIGWFNSYIYLVPEDLSTRILYLGEFNISASASFIKYLLQRAEYVYLHSVYGGCENIVPDMFYTVGGMNELTNLWLHCCTEFKCLIDTTSHHGDLFQAKALLPKLIKLKLDSMHDLKEVFHGPSLPCFFEKLQELHITNCMRLQSIFPRDVTVNNLKILMINNCPMLTSLFPMSVTKTMLLLQELTIKGCSKLRHIIEVDGTSSGTGLDISLAPDNSSLAFPQLKILSISSCSELEYIFPISCVHGFEQLEEVCIERASQLKYVFGQHEHEHNEIQMSLPLLRLLILEGLENLLRIFSKNCHLRCPSLRELHMVGCPKFTTFSVTMMVGSYMNLGNQMCSEPPTLHSFLRLEKLKIQNCSVQDILFPLEEVVFTTRDQQKTLTSSLGFLNLTNLPELKFIWNGPAQTLSLQNLKEFTVSGCNSLKTIFSLTILRSLKQLKELYIEYCDELEYIISDSQIEEQHHNPLNAHHPEACFPNLEDLSVTGCKKLKSLFPVAILARDDLPKLQCLFVSGAAQLQQVFGGEAKSEWLDKRGKIILPNLWLLTLKEVPRLIDFCQGLSTRAAHESSLYHRTQEFVWNARQMSYQVPALLPTILSVKVLEIQNCEAIYIFYLDERGRYRDKQELMVSELESLELKDLPEMSFIWKSPSPTQILSLQYLQLLQVNQCGKLKSIFSMVVHRNLPELTHIIISDCEELEEIIAENGETHNLSNPQMSFPKLRELKVERCSKLKFLLSVNMAKMLPQLTSLCISESAQLEEVFKHENEDTTIAEEEIVLPKLREIKLESLPSLVNICQRFKLHTMELRKVYINECPKFSPIL